MTRAPKPSARERYVVKWNGVGWAAHDTDVDWNHSVHKTHAEAVRAVKALNAGTDVLTAVLNAGKRPRGKR